jgi:hypothetical protein
MQARSLLISDIMHMLDDEVSSFVICHAILHMSMKEFVGRKFNSNSVEGAHSEKLFNVYYLFCFPPFVDTTIQSHKEISLSSESGL